MPLRGSECRVLVRGVDDPCLRPGEYDTIDRDLAAGAFVWLDVGQRDAEQLDHLGERFGLDPAAIEDVLDVEQLPKFNDYGDHLFVVLQCFESGEASGPHVSSSSRKRKVTDEAVELAQHRLRSGVADLTRVVSDLTGKIQERHDHADRTHDFADSTERIPVHPCSHPQGAVQLNGSVILLRTS